MNETHPISIAIDGPSGAGKSTLARRLASTLHFLYVDTGAIYRTIAYYAYANHLDPSDEAAVLAALPDIRIELRHDAEGLQRMVLNGEDVTDAIRLPQISQYASVVSAYPGVRAFLLEMQRDFARKGSVIILVAVYAGLAHCDLAKLNDSELDLNTTMMYRHEDYVDAIRFVREGMVQLQPLMSRHFAFTDYLAAYEYIDTHQETTMKVLIDVDPSDD